ncbi:hypothetical protein HK102_003517, partial [Quaeritorhiza haematococci]
MRPARPPPPIGTVLSVPGLDPFPWSDRHIPEIYLNALRTVGDDLADDALRAVEGWWAQREEEKKGGGKRKGTQQDSLSLMFRYLRQSAGRREDEDVDPVRKFMQQVSTVPEWVDWEAVERGQRVFWKYFIVIVHFALLHGSLIGGVAAGDATAVLLSTGYLTRPGPPARKRLLETLVWFLDCMLPGALVPGEIGWKSSVRVRLLHSKVRTRLRRVCERRRQEEARVGGNSGKERGDLKAFEYSIEENGVPINQEDMVGTLHAFTEIIFV